MATKEAREATEVLVSRLTIDALLKELMRCVTVTVLVDDGPAASTEPAGERKLLMIFNGNAHQWLEAFETVAFKAGGNYEREKIAKRLKFFEAFEVLGVEYGEPTSGGLVRALAKKLGEAIESGEL